MAANRLFLYDPTNEKAICIAKGYSNGWLSGIPYLDEWFDENQEYTMEIDKSRFELRTENDIPVGTKVTFEVE